MKDFLIFEFLSLLIVSANGHCGYPGVPKNGNVSVEMVGLSNPPIWRAFYQCKEGYLLMPPNTVRNCMKDDWWTGSIPLCVRVVTNSRYTKYPEYSIDKGVTLLSDNETSQLYGIQLKTDDSNWNNLKTANWSVENSFRQFVSFQYENSAPKNTITLVIDSKLEIFGQIRLNLHDDPVIVNDIGLLIYPDGCGHPQIPVNGGVDWTEKRAIYRCNAGFSLLPTNSTRICSKGAWVDRSPLCYPTADFSIGEQTYTSTVATVGITVFVIGAIALALYFIYKRNKCKIPSSNQSLETANISNQSQTAALDERDYAEINEGREMLLFPEFSPFPTEDMSNYVTMYPLYRVQQTLPEPVQNRQALD